MEMKRKPQWLRIDMNKGRSLDYVTEILSRLSLNTVCEEANCPNRMECFSKKTATFMILGSQCSRNCRFCNVTHGETQAIDAKEPHNIAEATVELGLNHVVITSVTRDDLPDGGAEHFSKVVEAVKERNNDIIIEVLIPDFKGSNAALKAVVNAKPQIINHNMETIPRLYSEVRPEAQYERSLELIKNVKEMDSTILTKSGIMVGLGESQEEVLETLKDLRKVDCDFLTIGQYLPPSSKHYPVVEYIHPDIFRDYKEKALEMGFTFVASDPLVRSSYHASEMYKAI